MNTLLVGDNHTYLNWGARGGSLALHQLLAKIFKINEIVYGRDFIFLNDKVGFVNTILPYNVIYFLQVKKKIGAFQTILKVEKLLGARDWLNEDPEISCDNLFRYKNKNPGLGELFRKINNVDLIIINGEGDLVFSNPPTREVLYILAIMAIAIRLKKKIILLNSMLSDSPLDGKGRSTVERMYSYLKQCDAIMVRDYVSYNFIRDNMPDIGCKVFPDSLFYWYPKFKHERTLLPADGDSIIPVTEDIELFGKYDFNKPYICIAGTSLAKPLGGENLVPYFVKLVERIKKTGLRIYLVQAAPTDDFLNTVAEKTGLSTIPVTTQVILAGAILANAKVLISGRFHPAIFSSLGGTPTVCLAANSHKMASIQETLEYETIREFSAMPSDGDIEEIGKMVDNFIEQGVEIRNKIKSTARKRYYEVSELPLYLKDKLQI